MSIQSCEQIYNFNNKEIKINIAEVPNFSDTTRELFKNLPTVPAVPENWHTCPTIAQKYQSLTNTEEMLRDIKEHSTREKIIACLKAAALISLVILSVFSFIATITISPALVPVCMTGVLGYIGANAIMSHLAAKKIKEIEQHRDPVPRERELPLSYQLFNAENWHSGVEPIGSALSGFGIIAPIFEAFTRESRLESVQKQETQALDEIKSELKTFNESLLHRAYAYYEQNTPELFNSLRTEIENTQTEIKRPEKLPAYAQAGINELYDHLSDCYKAKTQLQAVADFYHQFHDNSAE